MADQRENGGELSTWTEIASYLRVSVRQAQYYEEHDGMPVHRIGKGKARVWAYQNELDAWRRRSSIVQVSDRGVTLLTPAVQDPGIPRLDGQLTDPVHPHSKVAPDGAFPTPPSNNIPASSGLGMDGNIVESEMELRPLGSIAVRKGRKRWYAIATVVAILGAAWLSNPLGRPAPQPAILRIIPLTHSARAKYSPVLSDGPRLFFTEVEGGHYRVAQVSSAGGETEYLHIPVENPYVCDISPNRSELLVRSVTGAFDDYGPLWIVPLVGGSTRRLGNITAFDGSWAPDSTRIAVARGHELSILTLENGKLRPVLTVSGFVWWPRWSVDAQHLRFTMTDPTTQVNSLWEVAVDGRDLHRLLSNGSGPKNACCGNWTPDRRYYIFHATDDGIQSIWVIREPGGFFNSAAGEPFRLTTGPMGLRGPTPSLDGTRIFVRAILSRSEVIKFDTRSSKYQVMAPDISAETLAFSPDGKSLAYTTLPENALWISDRVGSGRRRLISPPLRAALPKWSPDGSKLAVMLRRPDQPWKISLVSSEGGIIEDLPLGSSNQSDPTWSADGTQIAFGSIPTLEHPDKVVLRTLDLKTRTISVLPQSEGLFNPAWSPNGKFIAAIRADSSRMVLFDVLTQQWTTLTDERAGFPEWSRDSQYIFFLDPGSAEPSVRKVNIGDRRTREMAHLGGVRQPATAFGRWIGLDPDGSLLAIRDLSSQEIFALEWKAP